ncbi:MAG: DNA-formamidopyrimidine glycosylase, partial [Bacilli bacterium]|nr:DNA-formamidopyrimidine glycosylase [Bacilli bacterium]
MPELPEVETVVELLKPIIVGSSISSCDIFNKKMILSDINNFERDIKNKIITNVSRKGKFIIWHFEDHTVLISHLRMEGKYIECGRADPISPYARIVFHLNDGRKICFDDTRQFGIMQVSDETRYLIEKPLCELGLEPFEVENGEYLFNIYKKIKRPIKEVILDQHILAGIGNIYADETLFRCKLHPLTPANQLTIEDCNNIIKHSVDVLNKAIELGGSTIRSYHAAKGIDGRFQNELLVYGQEGTLCRHKICHARYKKIFVNGRGTTYCPVCQRKRNKPYIIGVTGVIGSGKSTACNIFAQNNIKVISADNIVKELYAQNDIKEQVIGLLGPESYNGDQLNKQFISLKINNNFNLKTALENIIHPHVRKKIIDFINDNANEKILVCEIPLLYESKMDDLMDATLAIEISYNDQVDNLRLRNSDVDQSLLLNKTNKFNKYKNKLTYLLKTENKKSVLEDAI